ncbi:phosphatidylserine decarboxylase [Thioalkalivibrio sp. ALJT]|uniref:phosphatidylserine decarboxylase n=1 Tax=Thioalkalivibrio sp. ALJT TaxID=1158146 RepID=UPI00035E3FE4|nr:phosphatidylserine decarboxylase [Thioalkalivibrio sp. ALJT]
MLFPLAPEGRLFVIISAWMAVISLLFGEAELGLFMVILTVFLMAVFRDLRRNAPVPAPALGVIAPADATVEAVTEARDPFTGKPAVCIRLRQRRLGEYNVHAPQEAEIRERVWPGKETDTPPDAQLEGRLAYALENDEGVRMTLALSVDHWPRMIRMQDNIPGNRLGRGKRMGFAGFGGRFEIWLPEGAHVMVEPGQHVLAGSVLLGGLPGAGSDGDREGTAEVMQ